MCCEAVPRQVINIVYIAFLNGIPILLQVNNYLIDKAFDTGKGGNSIISMVHYFLAVHGFGEKKVDFHCDNCSSQNKNRFLVFYMMYQILCGLHEDVSVFFYQQAVLNSHLIGVFGLLKQHFKRSKVGCLDDIVQIVNESATPNVAQLVGSQSGDVIVPMYDWSSYFENITVKTALKGITRMHHFRFFTK